MKTVFLLKAGLLAWAILTVSACSDNGEKSDNSSDLSIDIEGGTTNIPTFKVVHLTLKTELQIKEVHWLTGDSLIGTSETVTFISPVPQTYPITVDVTDLNGNHYSKSVTLTSHNPKQPYSPYISQVIDYHPAPGQFVNSLPRYEEGDTQETMNLKVLNSIGNEDGGLITLGSFGGYVICGFDHTVPNLPGNDLRIEGNCVTGESEPGVISVAFDQNGNGKPDVDEWFELAGDAHNKGYALRNYQVTYYRPATDHTATPSTSDPYITDDTYIPWTDNQGNSGYVYRNQFHNTEDYYPQWIKENHYTVEGTRLKPNGSNVGTPEQPYWVLSAYKYGYADNLLNAESLFDIDWAVDQNGTPVHLPGIDFIRIHTGVLQYCGWLGETSTEISRITDLHLTNK